MCFLMALLYLLRDAFENLISPEIGGLARCQDFPTHREVKTDDRKHTLTQYSIYTYLKLQRKRIQLDLGQIVFKTQKCICKKTWLSGC